MDDKSMKMFDPNADLVCDEKDIYQALLPLRGARVLELGCGKAEKTRAIAETAEVASIMALEVDAVQHAENRQITDLPNVKFGVGGAEDIPAESNSLDIVLMFKSLHHVPLDKMDQALTEIRRVLKPGGLAYISEPVFAGELNDIIRLFHDEKMVREMAFAAVCRAVDSALMERVTQKFFSTPVQFQDFAQFEERILRVTHTHHQLAPELLQQVRTRFMEHMTPQRGAHFTTPIRVDLLRSPR